MNPSSLARWEKRSVLVSHPVHQHAYETAVAAQNAGMLHLFVTGIYHTRRGVMNARLLGSLPAAFQEKLERELLRRRHPELNPAFVYTIPHGHVLAAAVRRLAEHASPLRRLQLDTWADLRFDEAVGRLLPRLRGVRIVHAFEGAALSTFQAAKQVSVTTVLDVASAHEDCVKIASEADGATRAFSLDRIREERKLADFLFAPSPYVVSCLVKNGVSRDRILMLPYGVDESTFVPVNRNRNGAFRVLFVGQIGTRKGVRYLLDAWRNLDLPSAELILVGKPDALGRQLLSDLPPSCRWVGAVPKHEVHQWFLHSDVFVLPTLSDAWGLVVTEAMASGLPVITTTQCGAVVRDGRDGFVVPARSVEALEEKLRLLYDNRDLCNEMGSSGRVLVEEAYTWHHYHSRIAEAYRLILQGQDPREIEAAGANGR